MRYVTFVPANGLTIRVCFSEGQVIITVFCLEPGDPDNVITFPPLCKYRNTTKDGNCKCMEVFVNGTAGHPEEDSPQKQQSRRRARREATTNEVHITIEGMGRENVFVLDVHDGDDPNDCVGMMVADNCIYPEGMY